MANTKWTAASLVATVADTDQVLKVTDPGGTPASERLTVATLLGRAYGELYVSAGASGQSLTTSIWNDITQWASNGASLNTTPDHTNDIITLDVTGFYLVMIQMSFSGSNNAEFTMRAKWNGTGQDQVRCQRKLSSGGDVGSATAMGVVDVTTASTDLELEVYPDGNHTFTLVDGTMFCCKIGET